MSTSRSRGPQWQRDPDGEVRTGTQVRLRLTVHELARVLIAALGPGVTGLSHDEGYARLVVVDNDTVPAHEVRSRVREVLAQQGQDGVDALPSPSVEAIEVAATLYEAPTWAWKREP